MSAKEKVQVLKDFFGVSGKMVTSAEVITLKKQDPQGFEELANAAQAALVKGE